MKCLAKEEKIGLVNKAGFWYHDFDFGDGITTKGLVKKEFLDILSSAIPDDLNGKSVLDIGAWDGYYSFLCEKRGAKEVIAIDNNPYTHKPKVSGFEVSKKILDSKVNFILMDLYDIPKRLNRKFDVVIFYGVLYHLKNPLLALEIISSITKEVLVLESHCSDFSSEIPVMKFYPYNELNHDPTNWWGPNKKCIIDMLKVVGFKGVIVIKELKDISRILIKAYK